MNGISRAQQLAELDALVPPPDGWAKREAPLLLATTEGPVEIVGALEWGAFALHGSIDSGGPNARGGALHLRLTHVPTGLRVASGAQPLMLVQLAREWAAAVDWANVDFSGPASMTILDPDLCARLGDLREDFERWQIAVATGAGAV